LSDEAALNDIVLLRSLMECAPFGGDELVAEDILESIEDCGAKGESIENGVKKVSTWYYQCLLLPSKILNLCSVLIK